MSTEVGRVGHYVRTYDRDIFITDEQRRILYSAMDLGKAYFDLDDNRIMMSQIKEVVKSTDYEKSPVGGFYCPKHPKNFVPRGKSCGYC